MRAAADQPDARGVPLRLAVIGHVEHVTLGRADGVPAPGDIIHLRAPRVLPAGGGGLAFLQLSHGDAEAHLFTAFGDDDAGRAVESLLRRERPRAHIHAAHREAAHPRVVVYIDGEGRRTIIVTDDPLQPAATDPLPWSILASCDGVYFTGADPETLRIARAARRLVVTARRAPVLRAAGIAPDVIIGSLHDPRENAPFESYAPAPGALVLTDGPRPVRVIRAGGTAWVSPPPAPARIEGDYGAGDSFAAALTFFLAKGFPVEESCARAGPFGAAVLASIDPRESQARLPSD